MLEKYLKVWVKFPNIIIFPRNNSEACNMTVNNVNINNWLKYVILKLVKFCFFFSKMLLLVLIVTDNNLVLTWTEFVDVLSSCRSCLCGVCVVNRSVYRVGQIKWHHFTFLLLAHECIHKILWFLAHLHYIMQKWDDVKFMSLC